MVRGDQLAVKGWPIYSITRVYIDNFQGGQPSANYTQHFLLSFEVTYLPCGKGRFLVLWTNGHSLYAV